MSEQATHKLQFLKSTIADIDTIFSLYDDAVAYQKTVFNKHWQEFERSLIEREIAEGRQWKIVKGNDVVCIFAIDFNDALIWGAKDLQPSVYLHRIVTNPDFRGNNFIQDIITWSVHFGKSNDKEFVRMDTWGDNPPLIAYYVKSGFQHTGFTTPEISNTLPKHYEGITLALFEIPIG